MSRDPWYVSTRPSGRPSRLKRRLEKITAFGLGGVLVGALAAALTGLNAAGAPEIVAPGPGRAEVAALRKDLDDARGRLALAELRLERMTAVERYSALYRIPVDLAEAIYDIALAEGIHPSIGFQLVKVESSFQARARSSVGAIGYTQLMIRTARIYEPKVTVADLQDRDTNLRIGFRFLNDLLLQYDQDLHLALLAYNRGPGRVNQLMARGQDPANGYSEAVMKGWKGVRKGS